MARVAYSPEKPAPPLDAKLEEIALHAAAGGRAIQIRLQPDLYNPETQGYQSWPAVIWRIDCEDLAEGVRLREGLARFFAAFGGEKQGALLKALEGL